MSDQSNVGSTRRQTIKYGAGAAAAIAVPASLLSAAPAIASADTDALTTLIELEQASALAYDTAAKSGKLDSEVTELFDTFAEQEGEHVTAWSGAIDQLNVDPPSTPGSPSDSPHLEDLDKASNQDQYLDFLIEFEQRLTSAYTDQAVALTIEDLIRTGAQVAANHAQHLVALRQLRGDSPAELTEG